MPADDLTIRARLIDEVSGPAATARGSIDKLAETTTKANVAENVAATATRSRTRDLQKLHERVLGLSRDVGGAFVSGLKTATLATGALGAGLAVMGFKAAESFESARLGIQTFVGDAARGSALFNQLKQLQAPFDITNLQEAGQALLVAGTGADHLVPRMKVLADIAATQADPKAALTSLADAIGRIQEMGVIDARTLRPLLTAGIPVYELLGQELGVPPEKLRKTLATGAPVDLPLRFFADLEAETGPLARFAGALDKQRATLRGQLTLIKTDAQTALADTFEPVAQSLAGITPLIRTNLVALIQGVGPGLAAFLQGLAGVAAGLLPILQPIATAILGGLGQVLQALVPAFAAIAPQMPAVAAAFANLLIATIPLIPPLTQLTVALVPVLTLALGDMATVLTQVIQWITPLVDGISNLLNRSALARRAVEGLFGAILLYRTATSAVTFLQNLSGAIRGVAAAERDEASARAAGGGRIGAGQVGGLIAGAGLLISGSMAAGKHGPTLSSDLQTIGGTTALGATIGSIVPGLGTAIGAGTGAAAGGIAVGLEHLFGDTPSSKNLANTMAGHRFANAMAPGSRAITNVGYGAYAGSDHRAGRALDLIGSNLGEYARVVRAGGGYADMHGSHLHAVFGDTPSSRAGTATGILDRRRGAAVIVDVHDNVIATDVDLERAIGRAVPPAIANYDRARKERD